MNRKPSTCSVLPRDLASVAVADEQVDAHPHTFLIRCTHRCVHRKGAPVANSHPKLNPENLRPPWPPGTSGNPAGYSQGRRLSDAIENMIDELGLERSFAATAIAMALGHKHTLKQLVKDPVTGVDVWVEHQPDLAWFKMIVPRPRIEPAPQPMDPVTRLRTILQNIDRKERDAADQGKAAESPERSQSGSAGKPFHVVGPSGAWVPAGKEKAESTGTLFQDVPAQAGSGHNSLAIRRSPLATFQDVPAHAGSGQVALKAAQVDLPAGDPGTTLAVERPFCQRGADPARSSRALQSGPACGPAQGVPCSSVCGTVHGEHPRLSCRELPDSTEIGRRAGPGAGRDRRRRLLSALSPGRRTR